MVTSKKAFGNKHNSCFNILTVIFNINSKQYNNRNMQIDSRVQSAKVHISANECREQKAPAIFVWLRTCTRSIELLDVWKKWRNDWMKNWIALKPNLIDCATIGLLQLVKSDLISFGKVPAEMCTLVTLTVSCKNNVFTLMAPKFLVCRGFYATFTNTTRDSSLPRAKIELGTAGSWSARNYEATGVVTTN